MFKRQYLPTNQIFMKILAKMCAHEAKTRALAMPYKDSDPSQQKSRKCVFRPFLNRHQKKLFYSLLLNRQKYYESSKTEYVSPSNRPVRHIPDRSIRLPDRPRSFNNLGTVRLNLVQQCNSVVSLLFNRLSHHFGVALHSLAINTTDFNDCQADNSQFTYI